MFLWSTRNKIKICLAFDVKFLHQWLWKIVNSLCFIFFQVWTANDFFFRIDAKIWFFIKFLNFNSNIINCRLVAIFLFSLRRKWLCLSKGPLYIHFTSLIVVLSFLLLKSMCNARTTFQSSKSRFPPWIKELKELEKITKSKPIIKRKKKKNLQKFYNGNYSLHYNISHQSCL